MHNFDLSEFREEFFDHAQEEIGAIVDLLLAIENKQSFDEELREVFRKVHSLKGSSGSYEFYLFARICHVFEDYISLKDNTSDLSNFISKSLKATDLMMECLESYSGEDFDSESQVLIKKLQETFNYREQEKKRVLLIDASNSMNKIVQRSAEKYGFDLKHVRDGAAAFNLLFFEHYDLIITSVNLKVLDGISLIKGLKVMETANSNTPVLLISSDLKAKNSFEASLAPEHFLEKGADFINEIDSFLSSFVSDDEEPVVEGEPLESTIKKILYVEDDVMIHKLFENYFNKVDGVDLFIAKNPNEAVDLLKKEDPDIILVDYFLEEGKTAIDVLEELKKNAPNSKPIVVATATRDSVDLNKLSSLGNVKGIIDKPIKFTSVCDQLEGMIRLPN